MSENLLKNVLLHPITPKLTAVVAVIAFLLLIPTGCAESGAPAKESKSETYIVDTKEITVDFTEAEEFFLKDFQKRFTEYQLYDAGDLTSEILESRNGTCIVERCVGIVTDYETGDGMILNTNPDHYYISYSRMDGVTDGTVIVSYMVYSTTDNFIDGIEERYDYVISREYEKEVWM